MQTDVCDNYLLPRKFSSVVAIRGSNNAATSKNLNLIKIPYFLGRVHSRFLLLKKQTMTQQRT